MIKQNGLPTAVNKNELFKIDEPDMEMFNGFSENLKKKITSSPEWEKLQGKKTTTSEPVKKHEAPMMEDVGDIPF
jgi:hypothetical protein